MMQGPYLLRRCCSPAGLQYGPKDHSPSLALSLLPVIERDHRHGKFYIMSVSFPFSSDAFRYAISCIFLSSLLGRVLT
jgi:hypothetical protein